MIVKYIVMCIIGNEFISLIITPEFFLWQSYQLTIGVQPTKKLFSLEIKILITEESPHLRRYCQIDLGVLFRV